MVVFLKELLELRWLSWFEWSLAQGLVLYPHNHEAQDKVSLLSLTSIVHGHAGNLWTLPYGVQDVQVVAVCFNGLAGYLRVASCMACIATAVTQWCVPIVSGLHPGQDTLNKASASVLVFPAL